MKKPAILYLFSLVSLFCLSCNQNSNSLEKALKRAGKNRSELEKVLIHYKQPKDSLNYKAAVFLIGSMPGKFSYTGQQYDRFLHFVDSICNQPISVDDYKTSLDLFWQQNKTLVGKLDMVFDIDVIKSDFLIKNIDQACYAYTTSPWYKRLSFEDFCEYILPYRIGNEPLEDYKAFFYAKYSPLLNDSLYIQKSADSILKETSLKEMEIMTFPDFVPDLPISTLLKIRGGTCRESSNLGVYILRSMGIPVADDFTPQWPNRGMGHSWSALLINNDSCIDFEGATSPKVGHHLLLSNTRRLAKAYRHTYSIQKNSLSAQHGEEPVPEVFQSPSFKDVSTNYFKTADINVSLSKNIKNKYAYMCVFDNRSWVPIDWGNVIDNKVVFLFLGVSVVYMTAIFQENQIYPISEPMLLDSSGQKRDLVPDEKTLQTIRLKRKYPVFDWWNTRMALLKGGIFQASNTADFGRPTDVYKIAAIPEMTYQDVDIRLTKEYKYCRFLSADSSYGDIAEVEYYDEDSKILKGKVIGSNTSGKNKKENAFDNNPLTYFQGDNPNGNWVGLEFDKPHKIKKIRYLCRNDDNFIENGESYELYYWKNGNWKSLGKKIGDNSQTLIYPGAPTNALFLLHNITKGKEERIFTYDKGVQMWW